MPKPPSSAIWLGAAGLLPFALLALDAALGFGLAATAGVSATTALVAYGAVILSFLGGVQWGLAVAADDAGAMPARLVQSVIPSLIGWVALLVAPGLGLLLMAVAFAAMGYLDMRAAAAGWAPGWYPLLRLPLTAAVLICLFVGQVAA